MLGWLLDLAGLAVGLDLWEFADQKPLSIVAFFVQH